VDQKSEATFVIAHTFKTPVHDVCKQKIRKIGHLLYLFLFWSMPKMIQINRAVLTTQASKPSSFTVFDHPVYYYKQLYDWHLLLLHMVQRGGWLVPRPAPPRCTE